MSDHENGSSKRVALLEQLAELAVKARVEGWREADPGWNKVDALLDELNASAGGAFTVSRHGATR